MAKELDSIIQIDNEEYSITAKKVSNSLTIKQTGTSETSEIAFDGSEPRTIEFKTINGESIVGTGDIDISGSGSGGVGGTADAIKVSTDFGENGTLETHNATITISQSDPADGNIGNIWFKY